MRGLSVSITELQLAFITSRDAFPEMPCACQLYPRPSCHCLSTYTGDSCLAPFAQARRSQQTVWRGDLLKLEQTAVGLACTTSRQQAYTFAVEPVKSNCASLSPQAPDPRAPGFSAITHERQALLSEELDCL